MPLNTFGAVIKLQNGDILHAEILQVYETEILIKHPVLGEIAISAKKIALIDNQQMTEQNTPDKEPASTTQETDEKQQPATTNAMLDGQELTLANSSEAEATEPATDAENKADETGEEEQNTEKKNDTDETEQAPEEDSFFKLRFLTGWDSHFDVGLTGAAGSSNNASFRVGFTAIKEDEEHRWDINTYILYKQEDDAATDNKFAITILKDWFVNKSDWFFFSSGGMDWDEFKDWDYRLRLGGGSGYQFIKTDTVELSSRHGLNLTYAFYPDRKEPTLELLLGLDWNWNINKEQSIKFSNVLYPALTSLGDFRNVTVFEWRHKISYFTGMAIKFGIRNEYDTTETDRFDLKYNASFAWEL